MNRKFRKLAATLALVLGASVLAVPAFAQAQQTAPASQTPSSTTTKAPQTGPAPSNAELSEFAAAAKDIMGIKRSVGPQIAAAKSDADKDKLKQRAVQQMKSVVANHHLSLQRYKQIAMTVQSDPEVRSQVMKILQAESSKPSKS